MKMQLFTIFLFLSQILYSQDLEQNDIDIFLDNRKDFELFISEYIEYENGKIVYKNDTWKNYFEALNITSSEDRIQYGISNVAEFQNFLNCDVPDELESFFKNIGWENNGNIKFWRIGVGFAAVAGLLRLQVSGTFDENDQMYYQMYMELLSTYNRRESEIIFGNLFRLRG